MPNFAYAKKVEPRRDNPPTMTRILNKDEGGRTAWRHAEHCLNGNAL